jgi:hypothetical protein
MIPSRAVSGLMERPMTVLLADGIDQSRLDPRTIDPRSVGPFAAFINFSAFLCSECVRNGWLSSADAARGFNEFVTDAERLFSASRKGRAGQ